jgi:uncharacterized membrane protein YfcA
MKYWFAPGAWRVADKLPGIIPMTAAGFFIGMFSTLIGIGGGALTTMFLTSYGVPMQMALGTSSAVGMLISVPGVIGLMLAGLPQSAIMPPFTIGYVSLIGFALFAPVSVLAAPYGARMTHKLSTRRLEVLFGWFLAVVATRFLVSLVWG